VTDWRVASFITTVAYGLAMFFVAKGTRVHGGLVGCFLQMAGYAVLLTVMGFGRADLARITPVSLAWGGAAAALLCGGTYLLFHLTAVHPEKTALVYVISEGWPIITALIIHFAGTPLSLRQWGGVLLVVAGMVLVSLPQK